MRQLFIPILFIFLLSGCTTLGYVERRYNNISFSDGIDKNEAKIIAQRECLQNNISDSYKIRSAKVYGSEEVLGLDSDKAEFVTHDKIYEEYRRKLKYENSWFVSFRPGFLSFFSNYYLVVLDKKDGEIQYIHDSNSIIAIGQVMFAHIKLKLVSSMLIGKYYRDKNELPENIEQLRRYLSEKSEGESKEVETLKRYEIQKLSNTRVKVKYVSEEEMQDICNALSEITTNLTPKGEYELEVSTEGDKTILQIYGDMDMKFTLMDFAVSTGESKNFSLEDVESVEKNFDKLIE
ncbi:MAG: hypothetical protein H6755_06415 [Candidatus Omnitrophica bacterium]|nr:hypothetical protein [Candidatus Omnitrophota bacterium]MCB9748022.1 hypothetical protein [Candidatus Omnitrophota bacterium]